MVARNRVVISGTIAGAIERWSCSVDFISPTVQSITDPGDLQEWATAAAAVLDVGETDYPAITALMGANVNATRVDVYGYSDTGPAVATGQATFQWLGSGTISKPFSTSVCVTKRTGLAGRSRRGRMYWPALAAPIASDGTSTFASTLAAEFAELLNDLAFAAPVSDIVSVVTSQTLGVVTPVTEVAVGNVLDTQRSRRSALAETYQVAPVAP